MVIGDLADRKQVEEMAEDLNAMGPFDSVVHNAGVYSGQGILEVNVLAPYLLTALMDRPRQLLYASSSMHAGVDLEIDTLRSGGSHISYSDSKMMITTLAMALAELWPGTMVNAVDPGWVPTRMSGGSAPDSLSGSYLTYDYLIEALTDGKGETGGYYYHSKLAHPSPITQQTTSQAQLLEALGQRTGIPLEE